MSTDLTNHLSSSLSILVLGDESVGKTSLIARYVRNLFPAPRTLADVTTYPTVIDGTDYTLVFRELSSAYEFERLKLSDNVPTACLVLFSITDYRSFTNLSVFYESIRVRRSEQSLHMPILCVANKIDLEHERAVGQNVIDQLQSSGVDVFEISVKGNVGIGDVIHTAIKHLQYDSLDKVKPANACACLIA